MENSGGLAAEGRRARCAEVKVITPLGQSQVSELVDAHCVGLCLVGVVGLDGLDILNEGGEAGDELLAILLEEREDKIQFGKKAAARRER